MRSACRSAAGLPPSATLPAKPRATLRALATEIAGKVPICAIRDLPPRGRYWYQKVLRPLGRMRTPKPLTSVSQRKIWPVAGLRARSTATSVSFFAMGSPTAYRQQNPPHFLHGAVWGNMARYGGELKANRACSPFSHGALWLRLAHRSPWNGASLTAIPAPFSARCAQLG